MRTVSAVVVAIAAIAVALGVLTMAEESIDHTDLINDQNELLHQQISLMDQQLDTSDCVVTGDRARSGNPIREALAEGLPSPERGVRYDLTLTAHCRDD